MAVVNFAPREITAKVVWFGPSGAGTGTTARALHERLADEENSIPSVLSPEDGAPVCAFEWVDPSRAPLPDFTLRWLLAAMPGAVRNAGHRRDVLADADAIVFIADARPDRAQANVDALLELEQSLADLGRELGSLAVVIQVNHTDAADARPTERVVGDLNPWGFPVVATVATSATGVVDAFCAAADTVARRLADKLRGGESALAVTAVHRQHREGIAELLARLRIQATAPPAGDPAWWALPAGMEVEVPFQPHDLVGTQPVHLLSGEVDGDGIRLEVVVDRIGGGGTPRRLTIRLANRPTDAPAMGRQTRAARVDATGSPAASLPDHIPAPAPRPFDFPPVWYGIAGVAGGGVCGLLIGFLLFA